MSKRSTAPPQPSSSRLAPPRHNVPRSAVALQSHVLRKKRSHAIRSANQTRPPTAKLFNPLPVQHHPKHLAYRIRQKRPSASYNPLAVRHHTSHLIHRARQKLKSVLSAAHSKHAVVQHRQHQTHHRPGPHPRVLMFGWEFPPQSSGGLGTACEGLGKALVDHGANLLFVVPHHHPGDRKVRIRSVSDGPITFFSVPSFLTPYLSEEEYGRRVQSQLGGDAGMYGSNLFLEVHRYARLAQRIAREEEYDIIHAHDWMTYPAGIVAKRISGKPLVVHVHATEFDRSGDNPYPAVYYLEREGLHAADHIIAVSNYTKQKIVQHYGIPPEKVTVVHNAVEQQPAIPADAPMLKLPGKMVLFLGRITLQKGPDYFLAAAKKVLQHEPDVRFIIAGKGDMERKIIERAAELGIARNVLFAGFAKGPEVDVLYRMADLYVMPSVSEPFGITPLEALRNNTPVLISKQSGVSEVLKNALRADFWDIHEMANKIISALRYPALGEELTAQGKAEIAELRWDKPAAECLDVYKKVLRW